MGYRIHSDLIRLAIPAEQCKAFQTVFVGPVDRLVFHRLENWILFQSSKNIIPGSLLGGHGGKFFCRNGNDQTELLI